MTLKLKTLGNNVSVLETGEYDILFSYETPVAYTYVGERGVMVTATKYSKTTSKHINQWVAGRTTKTVPQTEIDALLA
jgi:hypothetical protein